MVNRTREVLFEQVNLRDIRGSPDTKHVLLRYYNPAMQNYRNGGLYANVCLFNLLSHECTPTVEGEPLFWYGGSTHWLDDETYLYTSDFPRPLSQLNVYADQREEPLPGWEVFAFAALHKTHELLVLARPETTLTPVPTVTFNNTDYENAGFYFLDIDSFQMSELLYPFEIFTSFFEFDISPDDRYAVINWDSRTYERPRPRGREILNIETGERTSKPILDDLSSLNWLPDSEHLIGVAFDSEDPYKGSGVEVNIRTSEIKELFSFEGISAYFIVTR
jgi:hypothetical protein